MSEPVTLAELRELQPQMREAFGAHESIAYAGVSMTQFSVARFYGSVTVNGQRFFYNPADDSLIREDVAKWAAKQRVKPAPKVVDEVQTEMFEAHE
jgi:hypothetical protein